MTENPESNVPQEQPKKDLQFEETLPIAHPTMKEEESERLALLALKASREAARPVSKEEAEKREDERIQRMISPELLKHFSPEQAYKLVKSFLSIPSVRTQNEGGAYDLRKIEYKNLELLHSEIDGKKVIEIGDAGRKINETWFKKLGASDFKVVDINQQEMDALTFLAREQENSAVVCSFGVFDDGSLYYSNEPELKKYIQQLCKEIYRVTSKHGISLHGLENSQDLLDAGFVQEVEVTPVVNVGNVIIFRK